MTEGPEVAFIRRRFAIPPERGIVRVTWSTRDRRLVAFIHFADGTVDDREIEASAFTRFFEENLPCS